LGHGKGEKIGKKQQQKRKWKEKERKGAMEERTAGIQQNSNIVRPRKGANHSGRRQRGNYLAIREGGHKTGG